MRWYVAMTKGRRELQWAAHRLLRQQGFESLLPFEEVTKTIRGKPIFVRVPLYPRYLFVGCDHPGAVHAINRTPGVSTVVWGVDGPYEVPRSAIEAELRRGDLIEDSEDGGDDLAGAIRIRPPDADDCWYGRKRLKRGTDVAVVEGPFAGFTGNVILDKGRSIVVEVSLFGRLSPAELPPSAVEPIAPEVRSFAL